MGEEGAREGVQKKFRIRESNTGSIAGQVDPIARSSSCGSTASLFA